MFILIVITSNINIVVKRAMSRLYFDATNAYGQLWCIYRYYGFRGRPNCSVNIIWLNWHLKITRSDLSNFLHTRLETLDVTSVYHTLQSCGNKIFNFFCFFFIIDLGRWIYKRAPPRQLSIHSISGFKAARYRIDTKSNSRCPSNSLCTFSLLPLSHIFPA